MHRHHFRRHVTKSRGESWSVMELVWWAPSSPQPCPRNGLSARYHPEHLSSSSRSLSRKFPRAAREQVQPFDLRRSSTDNCQLHLAAASTTHPVTLLHQRAIHQPVGGDPSAFANPALSKAIAPPSSFLVVDGGCIPRQQAFAGHALPRSVKPYRPSTTFRSRPLQLENVVPSNHTGASCTWRVSQHPRRLQVPIQRRPCQKASLRWECESCAQQQSRPQAESVLRHDINNLWYERRLGSCLAHSAAGTRCAPCHQGGPSRQRVSSARSELS